MKFLIHIEILYRYYIDQIFNLPSKADFSIFMPAFIIHL